MERYTTAEKALRHLLFFSSTLLLGAVGAAVLYAAVRIDANPAGSATTPAVEPPAPVQASSVVELLIVPAEVDAEGARAVARSSGDPIVVVAEEGDSALVEQLVRALIAPYHVVRVLA